MASSAIVKASQGLFILLFIGEKYSVFAAEHEWRPILHTFRPSTSQLQVQLFV
jgi:hypothetical protein